MKKIIYSLLFFILIVMIPNVVFADGFEVSETSVTMYAGESKKVTITATEALGDININSSGEIVGIDKSSITLDNNSEELTITGKSAGNCFVTLKSSDNFVSNDGEKLDGKIKVITVNILEKPISLPSPPPQAQEQIPVYVKSTNNRITDLVIEGQTVEKIDDNNYTLTVLNDVTNIVVNVVLEDIKAIVSGAGARELPFDEDSFEIVVTSESGAENKINVKVNRKDKFTMNDLDLLLKKANSNTIDIAVDKNTAVSNEELAKIRDSSKTVNLNYYDENINLLYTISLNANIINGIDSLNTDILSSDSINIGKLINDSKGVQINTKNKLSSGTPVKVYVGDKLKNEDTVDVYYYDSSEKNLKLYLNSLSVDSGYVEFTTGEYDDYYITKLDNATKDSKGIINIIVDNKVIIIVALCIALLSVAIILFVTKNRNGQKTDTEIEQVNDNMNMKNNTDNYNNDSVQENLVSNNMNDFSFNNGNYVNNVGVQNSMPYMNNMIDSYSVNNIGVSNIVPEFNNIPVQNNMPYVDNANIKNNMVDSYSINNIDTLNNIESHNSIPEANNVVYMNNVDDMTIPYNVNNINMLNNMESHSITPEVNPYSINDINAMPELNNMQTQDSINNTDNVDTVVNTNNINKDEVTFNDLI